VVASIDGEVHGRNTIPTRLNGRTLGGSDPVHVDEIAATKAIRAAPGRIGKALPDGRKPACRDAAAPL